MLKLNSLRMPRIELHITSFIFIMALYYSCVLNFPLLARIFSLSDAVSDAWFPYTAPLLLLCAFVIIFSVFAWPYFFKPFMIFLTLTSAIALYAEVSFRTLFDSGMMENVFETNTSEAASYLSVSLLGYVLAFGVLPCLFIVAVKVIPSKTCLSAVARRSALLLVAIMGILLIAATTYKDYASVGRNNRYLNKMIIPGHIYSSVRYLDKAYFTKPLPYQSQGEDATLETAGNAKPTLVIFMLGETARAMNYAYNGYGRDTNPYTKDMGIISFQHVSSCGTYTALSVPCMFSNLNRSDYSKPKASARDTVLNVMQHAGVEVKWFDNDGGDKGAANKVPYVAINSDEKDSVCDGATCFDAVMLTQAQQFINQDRKSKLIVLHLIGSHGPTYWRRYSSVAAKFSPACERSDIENCSDTEITNVYDNTLVYTDYVMSRTIQMLQRYSQQYNVALMYLSDHGESLGEQGLYLHGTPYAFAPKEQTQVPWLVWLPKQYAQQKRLDIGCIKQKALHGDYSHDNLFHSLLGFYGVDTQVRNPGLDWTSQCKDSLLTKQNQNLVKHSAG